MAGMPEIIDRNETEEQIAVRLAELEKLMQEAEVLRFRQFAVSCCTVILMLAILILFIIGLAAYFRSYPKRILMQEVVQQHRLILSNPYHFGLNREYDRKLIRYFIYELRKEMKQRRPVFRQELRKEMRSLHRYASEELRQDFRRRLYQCLTAETRQYLEQKKYVPDARQRGLLRQMNVELAEILTDRMFGSPDMANQEAVALFREETSRLRRSSMYQELKLEPLDMVENRMLDNLLECLVCRLDEKRLWRMPERSRDHE